MPNRVGRHLARSPKGGPRDEGGTGRRGAWLDGDGRTGHLVNFSLVLAAQKTEVKMRLQDQLWLTPKEVAEALNIGERTVRRYCRNNVFPNKRIGKLYRIHRSVIEQEGHASWDHSSNESAKTVAFPSPPSIV